MDYQQAQFYYNIATTILIALVGIQNYLVKKHAATISSIDRVEHNLEERIKAQGKILGNSDEAIKTRMMDIGNRLATLEAVIKELPTHKDLGIMYEKINQHNGEFKELRGEYKHIPRDLERIYKLYQGKYDV